VDKFKNIVVLGSTGSIGSACVNRLRNENPNSYIHCIYKSEDKLMRINDCNMTYFHKIDIFNEEEIAQLALRIGEFGKIDLFFNAVGFLHNDHIKPEKSLRSFNVDDALEYFKINTLLTPLWIKYFNQHLDKSSNTIAAISARLGSIQDDVQGGWYSYRASKTALNMYLKNLYIESKRSRSNSAYLSIQPGTVQSELSDPFTKMVKHKIYSPEESAIYIVDLLHKYHGTGEFHFVDGQDQDIPW
jgi:NAD(P)-dependent dehydrogenase (short-subunit alcohol dehydrogenase family)